MIVFLFVVLVFVFQRSKFICLWQFDFLHNTCYSREKGISGLWWRRTRLWYLPPVPFEVGRSALKLMKTPKINRLDLLDCKWIKSSLRLASSLASLPRVHLDNQSCKSYYWRLHTVGEGMVSTVEALYFAAWEGAKALNWIGTIRNVRNWFRSFGFFWIAKGGDSPQNTRNAYPMHWTRFWPFSEDAKEFHRALRKRHDGEDEGGTEGVT